MDTLTIWFFFGVQDCSFISYQFTLIKISDPWFRQRLLWFWGRLQDCFYHVWHSGWEDGAFWETLVYHLRHVPWINKKQASLNSWLDWLISDIVWRDEQIHGLFFEKVSKSKFGHVFRTWWRNVLKFPCQINTSFVFGWVGTWGICRGEGFCLGDLRFVAMSLALPCDKSTLAAAMAEEALREDQYDFVWFFSGQMIWDVYQLCCWRNKTGEPPRDIFKSL